MINRGYNKEGCNMFGGGQVRVILCNNVGNKGKI